MAACRKRLLGPRKSEDEPAPVPQSQGDPAAASPGETREGADLGDHESAGAGNAVQQDAQSGGINVNSAGGNVTILQGAPDPSPSEEEEEDPKPKPLSAALFADPKELRRWFLTRFGIPGLILLGLGWIWWTWEERLENPRFAAIVSGLPWGGDNSSAAKDQGNRSVGLLSERSSAARGKADNHALEGRIDDARRGYQEALHLAPEPRERAATLLRMAQLELLASRTSVAREFYSEARVIYSQEGDAIGEASAWVGLGHLERQTGNGEQARKYYRRAGSSYRREKDYSRLVHVEQGIAELEMKAGRYDDARRHWEESLALSRREDVVDAIGGGYAVLGLGRLESLVEDRDAARKHLTLAAIIFEQKQHWLGLAHVRHSQGTLDFDLDNLESARVRYNQSLDLFKQVDSENQAHAMRGLADVERELGNYDEARKHYAAAKARYERSDNSIGKAHALAEEAKLNRLEGRPRVAIRHLHEAAVLYQQEGMEADRREVLDRIAELDGEDEQHQIDRVRLARQDLGHPQDCLKVYKGECCVYGRKPGTAAHLFDVLVQGADSGLVFLEGDRTDVMRTFEVEVDFEKQLVDTPPGTLVGNGRVDLVDRTQLMLKVGDKPPLELASLTAGRPCSGNRQLQLHQARVRLRSK